MDDQHTDRMYLRESYYSKGKLGKENAVLEHELEKDQEPGLEVSSTENAYSENNPRPRG